MQESILMTEESEHETMFNEKQYHKIFQELSQARSDLRVMKQQNQWLKNAKQGLEQQALTLRDILRQKKSMITSLTEELSQKSYQLQQIQRQLSEELSKQQGLIETLKQYELRIQELTQQINSQNQIKLEVVQQQQVRKSNHNTLMSLTEQRLILHIDKTLHEMQHIFNSAPIVNVPEETISNKIETLININGQLVKSMEQLNRQLQSTIQNLNQKNSKIQELQLKIRNAQESHRLEMDKKQLEFKKQLNYIVQIEQDNKKTVSMYESKIEQIVRQLEDNKNKVDKYRQERDSLRKQAFQNYLPYLRPYIPEELPGLLEDLQNLNHGDQSRKIIEKQINRLENLYACQRKRSQKIEISQNSMKNEIVQLSGQNQILRLKVANLERAYQNAIDDYRRSIRFSTVTKKHARGFTSTTDKENEAGTGRNFN